MQAKIQYEWSPSNTGERKEKKGYVRLREFHHTTSIKTLSQQPDGEEMLLPPGANNDQVPLDPKEGTTAVGRNKKRRRRNDGM